MDLTQIKSIVKAAGRRDAGAMTTTASLTTGADHVVAPSISLPGSPSYDSDRAAWNLTADQRPAAVCVATSVAHVRAAIAYARVRGLHIAPQVTGHFAQGLPPLDRTLLLKLALHREQAIEVDPVARTARVPAGGRWIDVVGAVAPHGLAAMHGSAPTVGVMGYLVGGGLSFYGRAHGLATNHVRAFEVVTPDGRAVRADAHENAELFWALRGGGGGYAVITAAEIELLPYPEVTGGALFFAADHAPALLRAWRDWSRTASEAMTTTFRILQLPPLPHVPEPLRGVATVCVDGVSLEPAVAADLDRRLRAVAPPILGQFGPMPSAAVAHLHGDPEQPVAAIADGILLEDLEDEAMAAFLRVAAPGSPLLAAELRHIGGALATGPAGAGARARLEGEFLLLGVGMSGPAGLGPVEAHLDRLFEAMRPAATGTRFASVAQRWGSMRTCVPDSALERLGRLRAELDPDGLIVAPQLP
jgi:FAD/FMN-containing dehydrogenase